MEVRRWIRRHPALHRKALPAWSGILHLAWCARAATGRAIKAESPGQVRLAPRGQVAEAIWRGRFELEERRYLGRYVRPGMRVMNVGANSGFYAISFAQMVGNAGEVHAFEARARNFAMLARNRALNPGGNVYAHHVAISDRVGRLGVLPDTDHPRLDGHFRTVDEGLATGGAELVRCEAADAYCEALWGEIPAFDLLFVDVEGSEQAVLAGARRLLAASPKLLIVMEVTAAPAATGAWLRAVGFEVGQFDPVCGRLLPREAERGTLYAWRAATQAVQL